MPSEEPSGSGPPGRGTFIFSALGSFVAICAVTAQVVPSINDRAYLLNLLVQISSVMIGLTSAVAIFLTQSSAQSERNLASDYLQLFLEVEKLKSGSRAEDRNSGSGASVTLVQQLEGFMKDLKNKDEGERKVHRSEILVTAIFIVLFLFALLTSVIVGIGWWDWIWLPLALDATGSIYYFVVILLFTLFSYPDKQGSIFSLET